MLSKDRNILAQIFGSYKAGISAVEIQDGDAYKFGFNLLFTGDSLRITTSWVQELGDLKRARELEDEAFPWN